MNRKAAFNPWPWMPLIVIGITALPNILMIVIAHRLHPDMVEPFPYLASVHLDADKAGRMAFAETGYGMHVESGPFSLNCSMTNSHPHSHPLPHPGRVMLYRPNDPSCDRTVLWPDPAKPLGIALSHAGIWRVRFVCDRPNLPDSPLMSQEILVDVAEKGSLP